jgi:hypothetical protein
MVRFDMCTHYHAHGEHARRGRASAGAAGRARSSSRAQFPAPSASLASSHRQLAADGHGRRVDDDQHPPRLPTDSAKATGGNFTPFAVFFANPTTMYVTDEGSGNTLDLTSHAGLEKWSLVDGVWQLDYVLTRG